MDTLEKYFEKNRLAFNDEEPDAGHFARFEQKLDSGFGRKDRFHSRTLMLRIAAGLLILFTVTVFIVDFAMNRFNHQPARYSISGEVQDAVNFYDDAAAIELGSIKKLACCGKDSKEVYADAAGELKSLDESAAELKKALRNNPNEERIQSALIQNQQMKEKIMKNILRQVNPKKK